MRTIERTGQFKRDYKPESKGLYSATLDAEFLSVLRMLTNDEQLEPRYRDHALSNNWKDHRDCHIKVESASSRFNL